MNVSVRTDRRLILSSGPSQRHVLVRITAPEAPRTRERAPIHVAFVLDRSGSMAGPKLRLAATALERALGLLDDRDRFSVVIYDNEVEVLHPSTEAIAEARREAIRRVRAVESRGCTNLCGGWLRGAEQVAAHLTQNGTGLCLLLTDGLANEGVTDPDVLRDHARELRRRGVATTTFGVGADFDETLLQALAREGGGNFYFLERPEQIPDLLASELGEVLETVARDVAIRARIPAKTGVEFHTRLSVAVDGETSDRGFLESMVTGADGADLRLRVGDLTSGQELDVLLTLAFGTDEAGRRLVAAFSVEDRDGVIAGPPQTLTWEYAGGEAVDAEARDRALERLVSEMLAARARERAVELNRVGNYRQASAMMAQLADSIVADAGDDPGLRSIASDLRAESAPFAAPMDSTELKRRHYLSHVTRSRRAPDGKARKGDA
jgi:Ca-activated chloride channel family protein